MDWHFLVFQRRKALTTKGTKSTKKRPGSFFFPFVFFVSFVVKKSV